MGKHRQAGDEVDLPEPGVSRRILLFLLMSAVIFVGGVTWAFVATGGNAHSSPSADPFNDAGVTVVPSVAEVSGPPSDQTDSGSPSPSASPSRSASPSPSPSHPVAKSPTRGTTAAARLTASYRITNSWPQGYQVGFTVTNVGTATGTGWAVIVRFNGPGTISVWDADPSTGSGGTVTFAAKSYNATLAPGASATFGFTVSVERGYPPSMTSCAIGSTACSH